MVRVTLTAFLVISLATLAIFLTVPLAPLSAQYPQVERAITFGAGGLLNSDVQALYVDSSGMYYAGYYGLSNYEGQTAAVFIEKSTIEAHPIWSKNLGNLGSNFTQIGSLSGGPEGVYLVGSFYPSEHQSITWIQQYYPNGTVGWSHKFGSNTTDVSAIVVGPMGEAVSVGNSAVYLAGAARGQLESMKTSDSNPDPLGPPYLYVRKYELNGTQLWTRTIANNAGAAGIYSSDEGVYVLGMSGNITKFDPNGTLLWTRQVGASGISGDSTGVYVVGTSGTTDQDGMLRKYSLSGDQLWTDAFNVHQAGPGSPEIFGLQVSASTSGIFVAGTTNGFLSSETFTGASDSFILKFSPAGKQLWTYQFGPAGTGALSVSNEGVFVAGTTPGEIFGQPHYGQNNAFIVEFTPSSSFTMMGLAPPLSYGIAAIFATGLAGGTVGMTQSIRSRKRPEIQALHD